jgi:hypothetical protein
LSSHRKDSSQSEHESQEGEE